MGRDKSKRWSVSTVVYLIGLAVVGLVAGAALLAGPLNKVFNHVEECTITGVRAESGGPSTTYWIAVETRECGELALRTSFRDELNYDEQVALLQSGIGKVGRFRVGDVRLPRMEKHTLRFEGFKES